ncbi:dihydroneopterin aldolase [Candidatus Peribacteria bacterium RIFCSPHIGHO2_02_FULL_52_16]|nr:MAG: dihydroneopterin aldolase [Candidatus Peribacteria bacterium RIFCSPHIGHO2_01_FULL_51_35]OGJ61742.1 MAG: dihydroneopterin aldolase [Candidatus Peribacteria bacterium RIFCSPHIGHO2_02_FULL_52_16]
MDTITIQNLELWTHIGVSEEERAQEQRLLVSVEMTVDTKAAAKSDDVTKSIDYYQVSEELKKLAKTERKTIERFAEDAATMILDRFKPKNVTVSVKKFAVPGSDFVAIAIRRP